MPSGPFSYHPPPPPPPNEMFPGKHCKSLQASGAYLTKPEWFGVWCHAVRVQHIVEQNGCLIGLYRYRPAAHTHTHKHTNIRMHIRTHIHIRMYIRTHTHTHTHMRTPYTHALMSCYGDSKLNPTHFMRHRASMNVPGPCTKPNQARSRIPCAIPYYHYNGNGAVVLLCRVCP